MIGTAIMAFVTNHVRHVITLHKSLLILGKAVCTKIMRRRAILHTWLKCVGNETGSDFVHDVTFRLSTKVFQLHTFLFGCACALHSRRLRLLGFHDEAAQSDKLSLQFIECSRSLSTLRGVLQSGDYLP